MNEFLRRPSFNAARLLALLAIALTLTSHGLSARAAYNQYGEYWDDNSGCLYLYNGAAYQPTGLCRRYPDPNNPNFWWQFSNVNPQLPNWISVDTTYPGWAFTTSYLTGVKLAVPFHGSYRELINADAASIYVWIEPKWVPFTQAIAQMSQMLAASPQYAPVGNQTFNPINYADPGAADCYNRGWQWIAGTCYLPNPQQ